MSISVENPDVEIDGFEIRPLSKQSELTPGMRWLPRGGRQIVFQRDGNLVIYGADRQALWASDTHNKDVARLVMQDDGNLVMYDRAGAPVWSSNTPGNPGAYLTVREDGTLAIYSLNGASEPVWSSDIVTAAAA